MVSFSKLSRRASLSAAVLILCTPSVAAVPWTDTRRHAVHRVREVAPGLEMTTFHPEATFEASRSSFASSSLIVSDPPY